MNVTKYDEIFEPFYTKIQEDDSYFEYGLTKDEALDLAHFHSSKLLNSALDVMTLETNQNVSWYDKDDELNQFNFKLLPIEIGLITDLMGEKLLQEDEFKLKARENVIGGKSLNVFSPSNERKSFMSMMSDKISLNRDNLRSYDSMDRETQKPKTLDYSGFY